MFAQWIELAGSIIDLAGVCIIAIGLVFAAVRYVFGVTRSAGLDTYRKFRQDIGRVILLGLEVLVAADIIRTVAVTPTLTSVAVLAGIVAIRTFLSLSLQVELDGRFPWQGRAAERSDGH